jgi:taurine transport system ATP-binding protein
LLSRPDAGSGIVVDGVSMVFAAPGGAAVHALERVSLQIREGEMVTVLGPSGCGKTTLLNILAGFLAPTSGAVRLNGAVVRGPGAERGMVFQQGALFEWMTVSDNVGFGPRMAGRSRGEIRDTVGLLIEKVGLEGFGEKPVYQLSGGMQQRVALARCLANDPEVVLMDEPLGALDALTREKMQSLVLKLWKDTGKTIVLITHSVEEALILGERLIVMAPRPGRIEKEYRLPFAAQALQAGARHVKASQAFVQMREEILSMIWSMEDQMMIHDGAAGDVR